MDPCASLIVAATKARDRAAAARITHVFNCGADSTRSWTLTHGPAHVDVMSTASAWSRDRGRPCAPGRWRGTCVRTLALNSACAAASISFDPGTTVVPRPFRSPVRDGRRGRRRFYGRCRRWSWPANGRSSTRTSSTGNRLSWPRFSHRYHGETPCTAANARYAGRLSSVRPGRSRAWKGRSSWRRA